MHGWFVNELRSFRLIMKQAEAMPSNSRVLGDHRLPEHVSSARRLHLHASHFPALIPGLISPLCGLLRVRKNRERSFLLSPRFAEDECATDLRIITGNLRGQLRSYGIAASQLPIGGRFHAGNFAAAGRDQHKVVFCAIFLQETFDVGQQLKFAKSGLDDFCELFITGVGELRGFSQNLRFPPVF